MRKSNDPSESEPTYLGSLGVLDLDLTVCPDVFGLRAFDYANYQDVAGF